jgi:uncharacterized protein YukE
MSDGVEYQYQAPTQCYVGEHTTDFAGSKDMDEMKAMLANASVKDVRSASRGWQIVHDQLVGADGVKSVFDAAVDHIMQHWEGKAADSFAAKAKQISKQISDGAQYAHYTSVAMENAAGALETIKPQVDSMEKPSALSSAWDYVTDDGRDDSPLKADLAKGVSTQQALDSNRDKLSKGKEAQLEMAVKMEQLGAAYNSQTKSMGSWKQTTINKSDDYPGEPGGAAPVPVVIPTSPSVSSPRSTTSSRYSGSGGTPRTVTTNKSVTSPREAPASPRETGITGGVQKPVAGTKPQVGTGIDGISGGSGVGGGTTGLGSGVGSVRSAGGGTGGSVPGGLPGVLGSLGGGGAAGGAGVRGGGLARQRGGVVGAAKGGTGTGKGTQGGSGLHKSRGATDVGKAGKAGSGAMGRGSSERSEEEERREHDRPDYLVEDEETWTPERNVAPRVIE